MSQYSKGISRRTFLGGSALLGAGALAGLAGCSPSSPGEHAVAESIGGETLATLPSFFTKPEPITDIAKTKEFDVVVVGAGTAGVPAALSARKNGATVAVLQKESRAISQGNTNTGIYLDKSDPAGIQALVSKLLQENQFRSDRKLIEVWMERSGEALTYCLDRSQEGPYPASITSEKNYGTEEAPVQAFSTKYGVKPVSTAEGILGLAEVAAKDGVEFFYETPGIQLVQDENGRVSGVIGQSGKDYIQFNANKGVILATGDYQNDDEMVAYYCPDVLKFDKKQLNKTGDGHKMGLWAGAQMEPIPHTKMIHDFDSGPMFDEPFLWVDENAERFCNETVGLSLVCNYLRTEPAGWYSQIFDANYQDQVKGWGGKPTKPEDLAVYMPEADVERVGVHETFIATYQADTLDELAKKLEIPADALKKSVERYNELVASGKDDDFGKDGKYLQPIDTPPFYGIHKHVRVSALCSGLIINEKTEVLDANNEPIPGLYAAGNCSGPFYGGVDYPLPVPGLSIGRCFTFGYVAGEIAAKA